MLAVEIVDVRCQLDRACTAARRILLVEDDDAVRFIGVLSRFGSASPVAMYRP